MCFNSIFVNLARIFIKLTPNNYFTSSNLRLNFATLIFLKAKVQENQFSLFNDWVCRTIFPPIHPRSWMMASFTAVTLQHLTKDRSK